MIDYSYNTYFDEDILPPGQKPILTKGVEQVRVLVDFLLNSKTTTGYSKMAVMVGASGAGKSIAFRTVQDEINTRYSRGLPLCLTIKAKPGSSPRQLVEDLVLALGEKPRRLSTNRFRLADQAAEIIFRNNLRLLGVDDAEELDALCYNFLRYLFAKTGCAMLVIGLKPILGVIWEHEKFENRLDQQLDFPAPSEEEVLKTILPQLTLPYWSFDPTSEKDLLLGKKLWDSVKPSFRSLRKVLQNACQFADGTEEKRITEDLVLLGFHTTPLRRRPGGGLEGGDQVQEEEGQATQTGYENESVLRQRGKKKGNKQEE